LYLLYPLSLSSQPDVTVDAGSDEKEKVGQGSDFESYPVTTWSKSGEYEDVVIVYSQDCTGVPVAANCSQPTLDFTQISGDVVKVVNVTSAGGRITLSGPYEDINLAMQNLIIKPGAGNPSTVYAEITASVSDGSSGTLTATDSFTIPVVSVSSMCVCVCVCVCFPLDCPTFWL